MCSMVMMFLYLCLIFAAPKKKGKAKWRRKSSRKPWLNLKPSGKGSRTQIGKRR